MKIIQRLISLIRPADDSGPDPEFVASQLRKPQGDFAQKISAKMDEVNAPLFDLTLEMMKPSSGDSILEIGFGSGTFFEKLFEETDNLKVSGVDYSREMVIQASDQNRPLVDSGTLSLVQSNSNDLPFPDKFFDKVYCNMVVYFWDEPSEHLKEVHRVLKDGGKFYTGIRSVESMKKLPFIEHGFNLYSPEKWSEILAENSFMVSSTITEKDPYLEVEGSQMQMESVCIEAVKSADAD